MKIRKYSELKQLDNFEDRYEYLKLDGSVGTDTFGWNRYLNQALYRSKEWEEARRKVLLRDNGCDLGSEGHEIYGKALIHHMNPITEEQILNRDPSIFDPEYLITVTHRTHNAIHYGDKNQIDRGLVERTKNDTCPWKKEK